MLGRRHLRIKVLQALYAFFQSGNDRIDIAEKELLRSLDKLQEIYISQFSILLELVKFSTRRMDDAKTKFLPTEADLHPNMKFIQNRVLRKLENNHDLKKEITNCKITWHDQPELIRSVFARISSGNLYKEYMESEETSFEEDKEFLIRLAKRQFPKMESLHSFYEEKNIYWAYDYHIANHLLIKAMTAFQEDNDAWTPIPRLLDNQSERFDESDIQFIKLVFRKAIIKDQEYEILIQEKLRNWEVERLAVMDIIILKMALVELLECKSIPVKVTLNEYIELAKLFSTPKSSLFINGILDKLIADLKADEKIQKVGIGLIDK